MTGKVEYGNSLAQRFKGMQYLFGIRGFDDHQFT